VTDAAVAQLATLGGLVITLLVQLITARQNRKWQVEDRDLKVETGKLLEKSTDLLAVNTKETEAALEQTTKISEEVRAFAHSFSGLSTDERRQAREYAIQQDLLRRASAALADEMTDRRVRNVGPMPGGDERRHPRPLTFEERRRLDALPDPDDPLA
jgi:hypothetical protein